MGCDIHTYVEYSYRSQADDTRRHWQCIIQDAGGRDYRWFGRLAGVRTGETPMFPVRGLPDGDISYIVEDNYKAGEADWHSASHLSFNELVAAMTAHKLLREDGDLGVEWAAIYAAMHALEARGCDTRIIFWFDN